MELLQNKEDFQKYAPELIEQWSKMTKEELLNAIVNESIDAVNATTRVQLFMNECTFMSKTNYTLDVIQELITSKKQNELNEFCHDILDKEYNEDERTYDDIVNDLKIHADKFV